MNRFPSLSRVRPLGSFRHTARASPSPVHPESPVPATVLINPDLRPVLIRFDVLAIEISQDSLTHFCGRDKASTGTMDIFRAITEIEGFYDRLLDGCRFLIQ